MRLTLSTAAIVLLSIYAFAVAAGETGTLRPVDLRCEYLVDPLGIDTPAPLLGWRSDAVDPAARGLAQSAYEICVASSPALLEAGRADLWDSGKVAGPQSIAVAYAGKQLSAFTFCYWSVRVWDTLDAPSAWSATAHWSIGPLAPTDWQAKWIGKQGGGDETNLFATTSAKWIWREPGAASSAPVANRYFRRVVQIPNGRAIHSAVCQMTADDGFSLLVNGVEVGKSDSHTRPIDVDVTSNLKPGANVLAVAAFNKPGPPLNPAGLIGALRIEFADGVQLSISTDDQWRASADAPQGWDTAKFDDSTWPAASVLGAYGMAPWGNVGAAGAEHRRLAARMLRQDFDLPRHIKRATAYVCGLGFFELYLNGEKVSDHVMDPAISNYAKNVCYVTFDVTHQLRQGSNAVGVILGNGRFFAPRLNVPVPTHSIGVPRLLFKLRTEFDDGSVSDVVSDDHWKVTDQGPIRSNNEYDGEEYDARREMPGWSGAGFDAKTWKAADVMSAPPGALSAQMLEPMRVTETIHPVAITSPSPGVYLVDFGQSLYGMVQLHVRGPAGTRVQIRTSFAKRPDGTLKTEDNRSALTTDVYTLRGGEEEVWSPRFRGQGTRFAEITGFPGAPTPANFDLLVVHTDMQHVGEFSCSNALLNQIYANNVRSIRMQNRSVPMEPDRDERQPWLGHPAKTCASEAYVYDVHNFYRHFLSQTRSDQQPDGNISDGGWFWDMYSGDPVWPSVIAVVPHWLYDFYGDRRTLEDNYPAMRAWLLFQKRTRLKPDFTLDASGYADWVDASSVHGRAPDNGSTSGALIATAYFYHNCRLASESAALVGKTDDAQMFGALADRVAGAFNPRFYDAKAGNYESRTQLACALPLAFGLVPADQRQRVVDALVDDILVKHHGHLSVGLVGMQWYMQVLTQIGRPDVAFTVATQTTQPSWGYMISRGATSIWERWDQDTRDPSMNGESQMILAGDLVAWMYQTLGGIAPDPADIAFHRIVLRPRVVGDLTSVHASFDSLYGPIKSDWHIEQGLFKWTATVPPNTSATIYVPAADPSAVTEGGKPIASASGLTFIRREGDAAVYQASSGTYQLEAPFARR